MFSVSCKVLTFGCLEIESITAGDEFWDAYPILTALPTITSATSFTRIGEPLRCLMNELPNSSKSKVRATPRTEYSLPY